MQKNERFLPLLLCAIFSCLISLKFSENKAFEIKKCIQNQIFKYINYILLDLYSILNGFPYQIFIQVK